VGWLFSGGAVDPLFVRPLGASQGQLFTMSRAFELW
jgi:hypothetical protein